MTLMTILNKLKAKLSLNVSSSESDQTSHHTLGVVTISNEVINGTSKECGVVTISNEVINGTSKECIKVLSP